MQQEHTGIFAGISEFLCKLFGLQKKNTGMAVANHLLGAMDTFTDPRDGKVYRTIKIGDQIWMAENLNFEGPGSKCYYDEPSNAQKYGRLYTWYGAKFCPPGWHLPSEEEWNKLNDFVGGEKIAGTKLKARNGWDKNGNGTDDYGFCALPGGYGHACGNFGDADDYGYWWSAHEINAFGAFSRSIGYDCDGTLWGSYDKSYLFSVRCVKDSYRRYQ